MMLVKQDRAELLKITPSPVTNFRSFTLSPVISTPTSSSHLARFAQGSSKFYVSNDFHSYVHFLSCISLRAMETRSMTKVSLQDAITFECGIVIITVRIF